MKINKMDIIENFFAFILAFFTLAIMFINLVLAKIIVISMFYDVKAIINQFMISFVIYALNYFLLILVFVYTKIFYNRIRYNYYLEGIRRL